MPKVPLTPARLARVHDSRYTGPVAVPYAVMLAWGQGRLSDGAFKFYCAIVSHRQGIYAEFGDRQAEAWAHVDRHYIPGYLAELRAQVPAWFAVFRRESAAHPDRPGARSKYLVPFPSRSPGGVQPTTVDNSAEPDGAAGPTGGVQPSTVEGYTPPVNRVVKSSGRESPPPADAGSPPALVPAVRRERGAGATATGAAGPAAPTPPADSARPLATEDRGAPAASVPGGFGAVPGGGVPAGRTSTRGEGRIRKGRQTVADAAGDALQRVVASSPPHLRQAVADAYLQGVKQQ